MRRLAVAGLAVITALGAPVTASASCIQMSAKQLEQQADVIFRGVALEGPTPTGVQRFRVVHYLKGAGPEVAPVATGVTKSPDGGSFTSVSIRVSKGEVWRILGQRDPKTGVYQTSDCAGSGKLAFINNPLPSVPEATGNGGGSGIHLAPWLAFLALGGLVAAALIARRRFRADSA